MFQFQLGAIGSKDKKKETTAVDWFQFQLGAIGRH